MEASANPAVRAPAAPRRKIIQCFICWKVSGLSLVEAFYRLRCRHYVCSLPCLKTHLKNFQEYTGQVGSAMCPAPNCSSQLTADDCAALFQGQAHFQAWLHKREEKARPQLTCAICNDEVAVDESVTLECEHRYCRVCVSRMLELAIQDGQRLQCPDCQQEIDVNIVRGTVEPGLYERYIAQSLQAWQPPEGEFWFDCPTPDCPFRVLAIAGLSSVECPVCRHKFCPRCRHRPHKGTCEAFAKWREENGEGERRFQQLAQQQLWKPCPHCRAMVEKTNGCDHMVCYSPACRGTRAFCYRCGRDWNGHRRCG